MDRIGREKKERLARVLCKAAEEGELEQRCLVRWEKENRKEFDLGSTREVVSLVLRLEGIRQVQSQILQDAQASPFKPVILDNSSYPEGRNQFLESLFQWMGSVLQRHGIAVS